MFPCIESGKIICFCEVCCINVMHEMELPICKGHQNWSHQNKETIFHYYDIFFYLNSFQRGNQIGMMIHLVSLFSYCNFKILLWGNRNIFYQLCKKLVFNHFGNCNVSKITIADETGLRFLQHLAISIFGSTNSLLSIQVLSEKFLTFFSPFLTRMTIDS